MTTLKQKYLEMFAANCLRSVELTKIKNEGYTAGTADPYANFRFAAQVASLPGQDEVSIEQTILSRMCDKISRIKSLIVRPEATTLDESLEDSMFDVCVYANIMLTFRQLGRPEGYEEYDVDVEVAEITQPTPEVVPYGEKIKEFFGWGSKLGGN